MQERPSPPPLTWERERESVCECVSQGEGLTESLLSITQFVRGKVLWVTILDVLGLHWR